MKKRKTTNYIDDNLFYEQVKAYIEECDGRKAQGLKPDKPSDEILLTCYEITKNYYNQRKFYNMPEEVFENAVSLSIEFCIKYLHNFDPVKYKKPFTYVTTFANNALLQCYNKDRKERDNKIKYMTKVMSSSTYIRTDGEIDMIMSGDFAQSNVKFYEEQQKNYLNDKEKAEAQTKNDDK